MFTRRKSAAVLIAGMTGLAVFVAASEPALAGWDGRWNAPLAAGVIGGLAIGALANSHPQPVYTPPPPPPPAYVDEYDAPIVRCHWVRQPLYDGYGDYAGSRHVRVCD